jgi:hypothetical protein
VPTSKRPQFIKYPRIPSRILKGTSNEEVADDVVAVVSMFIAVTVEIVNLDLMECRDI